MYNDRKEISGCLGTRLGGRNYQRAWESFGGDRYVNYLDCGNNFMGIYCQTLVQVKYVQFIVHHLTTKKAVAV